MRLKRQKLICLVLVTLLLLAFTSTAFASAHIQWNTTDAFYRDDGKLVIRGYFMNDGSETIDRVNYLDLTIYFRRHGSGWWPAYSNIRWTNFNVYLSPGQRSQAFNLIVTNSYYDYEFDNCHVSWKASYHYIPML
jgi:hypothetical protein